jgi:predicted porin
MKKTLIAAAVVAVCGAASAQVSVSGNLGFGYAKTQPAPHITTGVTSGVVGMQMTDGEIGFKAVEDLGGGFKATVDAKFQLAGRDSKVSAKDATVALLTPIGQITAGSINTESEQPRAFADTKIALPSDASVSGGDNLDLIAFTTKLGPVYATLSYAEAGTQDVLDLATVLGGTNVPYAPGATTPLLTGGTAKNLVPGGPGAGAGPVQITSLNGTYDGGPLVVALTLSSYSVALTNVTDRSAAGLFRAAYDGRMDTLLMASYDLGMAKLGFGYNARTKGWGNEIKAGVSVPLGAITFGFTFEQKADDSKTLGDGVTAGSMASGFGVTHGNPAISNLGDFAPATVAADFKGTAKRTKYRFGFDYALSKQTSLNISYGSYTLGTPERAMTGLGKPQPGDITATEHQIRLLKTF